MTNCFVQFSFLIPGPFTDAEEEWLENAIDPDVKEPREWFEDDWMGFEAQFGINGLTVYSDEYGAHDMAESFVSAFLTTHRPALSLGFSWAESCATPMIDGFGGGAVVVYGDGRPSKWLDTGDWLTRHFLVTKP